MLPQFVGIGVQKCGTSWVHEQLAEHPEVFVPAGKELDFFFRDRGLAWYEEQFAPAPAGARAGELSPNYFARLQVCVPMKSLLPAARLFCVLRDPVERAHSQWKMARERGNIPAGLAFIDAFRADLRFLRRQGDYAALLEVWSRYYPLGKQLLVLFHDDLRREPAAFMRRLCLFLGVDPDFRFSQLEARVNASSDATELAPTDAAEVCQTYWPGVQALGRRLGRDLSHWNQPRAGGERAR